MAQKRELERVVETELAQAYRRDQSQWTLLNESKNFREYVRTYGDAKIPSKLNACRMITLGSKRGTLATSDNRVIVYPELKNRKPHGKADMMLIKGTF